MTQTLYFLALIQAQKLTQKEKVKQYHPKIQFRLLKN